MDGGSPVIQISSNGYYLTSIVDDHVQGVKEYPEQWYLRNMSEVPFYVDIASVRPLQARPILHKIFEEWVGRRLMVESKSTVRKPKGTLRFPLAYGIPEPVNTRRRLDEGVFMASMKRKIRVVIREWQILATTSKYAK